MTSIANFSALFLQGFNPPPPEKNHAQNGQHSSPISHFKTPNVFSPTFCLRGRTSIVGHALYLCLTLLHALRRLSTESLRRSTFGGSARRSTLAYQSWRCHFHGAVPSCLKSSPSWEQIFKITLLSLLLILPIQKRLLEETPFSWAGCGEGFQGCCHTGKRGDLLKN